MSLKCPQCDDPHLRPAVTRRDVLVRAAHGFGAIALASLLPTPPAQARERVNALAAKPPHFKPKAKSVIFLFMVGAPSHIDTFDPKPALEKYDGQLLPASYGTVVSEFTKGDTPLLKSPWKFSKYGQCGREVSTLFPHMAQRVDDLCFVRSFYTESTVHAPAMYQVNTGRILMGYPSMGSWITYGLGSESENLPAYVVMPQPEGTPEGGTPCWGAGFLPAVYQGTVFRPGSESHRQSSSARRCYARAAASHARLSAEHERDGHARFRHRDGGAHQFLRAGVPDAEPRSRSRGYLERNRGDTRKLYGLDQKRTSEFGTRCLLARRLVERGVRFVQIYSGGGPVSVQWDAHSNLVENHEKMCGMTDLPVAGLLHGSETARTAGRHAGDLGRGVRTPAHVARRQRPRSQSARLHHVVRRRRRQSRSFHRRDRRIGSARVGQAPTTCAISTRRSCNLLGLDQNRLWFLHNGRNEKLTDFGGNVIQEMLA